MALWSGAGALANLLADQWTSYGWNVARIENGGDYGQVLAMLRQFEDADFADVGILSHFGLGRSVADQRPGEGCDRGGAA